VLAAIGAAQKDHAVVRAGADAQQELEDVAAHLRVVVEELGGVVGGLLLLLLFVVGLQVVGEDGEDARARVGEAEARVGEVLLEQVDEGLCLFFGRGIWLWTVSAKQNFLTSKYTMWQVFFSIRSFFGFV
jgi:hypothetical protein